MWEGTTQSVQPGPLRRRAGEPWVVPVLASVRRRPGGVGRGEAGGRGGLRQETEGVGSRRVGGEAKEAGTTGEGPRRPHRSPVRRRDSIPSPAPSPPPPHSPDLPIRKRGVVALLVIFFVVRAYVGKVRVRAPPCSRGGSREQEKVWPRRVAQRSHNSDHAKPLRFGENESLTCFLRADEPSDPLVAIRVCQTRWLGRPLLQQRAVRVWA